MTGQTGGKEVEKVERKIMERQALQDVVDRLNGCKALVHVLCENAGTSVTSEEALDGIGDLLGAICKDFQAEIDSAEDCQELEER